MKKYKAPRIIRVRKLPDVWPETVKCGRPVYGSKDSAWVFYLMWLEGY
jgi:hypothetical protein